MAVTKRYLPRAPGGKPDSSRTAELQVRIPCAGMSCSAVLEEVSRALSNAEQRGMDPLIVLEELGSLRDSVVALVKGLSRLLGGYPRTVTFWESSGYTEAFLSVMERTDF